MYAYAHREVEENNKPVVFELVESRKVIMQRGGEEGRALSPLMVFQFVQVVFQLGFMFQTTFVVFFNIKPDYLTFQIHKTGLFDFSNKSLRFYPVFLTGLEPVDAPWLSRMLQGSLMLLPHCWQTSQCWLPTSFPAGTLLSVRKSVSRTPDGWSVITGPQRDEGYRSLLEDSQTAWQSRSVDGLLLWERAYAPRNRCVCLCFGVSVL